MHRPAVILTAAILLCALSAPAQITPASKPSTPGQSAGVPEAAAANPSGASATPEQAALLKSTEAFLRNLFAWGPETKVQLGPLQPSPAPDFYGVPVRVTTGGQTDGGMVYVSKDGKTVFRGDLFRTTDDPFAEDRAHIHLDGNPYKGPKDAKVVVVEFSDFQCPHCRQLYEALKTIEPNYPQVRFVFKDFPLVEIHSWAETAAVGARCAYMQSPDAFWKVHDEIFDNQEIISPENVWQKMVDFAGDAGLDTNAFKTCLASDEAKKAVGANLDEGTALGVNSTPTVYVNGRPDIGGDPALLEHYIKFEMALQGK